MRTLSILIICLTLAIFYSLARYQQNKFDAKLQKIDAVENNRIHETSIGLYLDPYVDIEEDFSMEVTGKEHRYLNTGLSCIEHVYQSKKKHVMVAQTEQNYSSLSGS